MSTERKTELGRDLQRRADACKAQAKHAWQPAALIERCEAKAQAYEHAAELADAAAPEPECEISADGRCYPEQDGHCHWCDNEVKS